MVRAGDGRGWVMPGGGVGGVVDPMTVSPGGVPEHRGANAAVLQKRAIAHDDVGLVTEATDDPFDRAHAVTDARGELVCSVRVTGAKRRVYHTSDMVTRCRVRLAAMPDGRRARRVARVERVSFETRECELAARERRLRDELDVDLGYAVGCDARSAARPWEL
jgi:hypothetical protein